jgi:hypothetical protein
MFWLGDQRGFLLDAVTQAWVRATGRRFDPAKYAWLDGPIGDAARIGPDFFDRLVRRQGGRTVDGLGLLSSMTKLFKDPEACAHISLSVREFYEQTSRYRIDAWSSWVGGFWPFGRLLASMFSRRLEQLNLPIDGIETSQGMTSQISDLIDRDGRVIAIAWVRTLKQTGRVVYCGTYSTCVVPRHSGICLKVCFPLPNGNATVILWPKIEDDGSLTLTSSGDRFGDPGFYFIVHHNEATFARYVRGMRERIHVYQGAAGEVAADHDLFFFGKMFLRLRYRLAPQSVGA